VREVVNGIMYVLSIGCQWRYIPKDLPPKSTLHDYLVRWNDDNTLTAIHYALYLQCREMMQREPTLVWHSIGFADGTLASLARPRV
jgi:transposase